MLKPFRRPRQRKTVPAINTLSRILIVPALFIVAYTITAQAPVPGVESEFLFSEGSGTTTADGSGNGHTGTLTNGPLWIAGKYGQGISFDGTNDYVNIPDHNNYTLDPSLSYTWSAWVNNNSFKEWSTVWSQTLNQSNFFYFYAHTTTDPDGGPVTNGISVYWWVNNGASKLGAHSSNNVLTAGQWSYVTVTYDAAQPQNNRFTIYVNGTDVTVRNDVSSVGTITTINPSNIRIGSNQAFGEYLNGSVDEVRYYRRLLTTTEILTDMNTGSIPDGQAPQVSLTAPANGLTVTGTLNVTADASDNTAVTGVQFLLDGQNLGAEDLAAPYAVSWNSATATNGSHTLTARARDAAGNSTLSSPSVVTVFNTSLVASYGFNENAGTQLTDNSGNGNTGTLTNGPLWSPSGKFGAALLFDGTNDLVNINDANSLDLTAGMTLEAWVNPSNLTGYKTVISKENGTNNLAYTLAANNSTSGTANQRPTGRIRIGSNTRTVTGASKLPLNTWTHLASTYDGTTMRIYINGVQSSTFATTGSITATTNLLRIGGSPALGTQYFAGLIDEVRIYNRALTQTEIQTDMNAPIAPDQVAPSVDLTAPAAGSTLSGTLNVTANATDNIGVSGVQFLLDGNSLGAEDLAAPYSVSWNTATIANGSHTLSARARDAAGNTKDAAAIPVTINNDTENPVTSVTAPGAGTTVAGTITITADASDNTAIAGLQFMIDGVNQGAELTSSPYSISWNTTAVADGNHILTTKARDLAGNIGISAPVTVSVLNTIPDTGFPTVDISSPQANSILQGTLTVTANAADNIGVAGLQFLLDGNPLGAEDLTSPYSVSWNTLTAGNGAHLLTARARDAAGNTTVSAEIPVTVNNDLELPLVSLTAPAAGNVSGTVDITADASDNTAVAGVQFILDGNNLGTEDITAPYSFTWNTTTLGNGNHILTAKARDAAGNTATSAPVTVTVNNVDSQSPQVSITAPAAGTVSGTVTMTANASDNIAVAGVQFLLDGSNIGAEDVAAPYSVSWNTSSSAAGPHVLTARARDAAGNTATSAAINVTVNNVTGLIAAINLNEGSGTNAADLSGKLHNGTMANSPGWLAGKYGQAINFNGSSSYMSIADHADFTLDPAQNYTWSSWVKNNNFNQWGTVWGQTIDVNNFFYYYAHTTGDAEAGPVTNGISVYWFNGSNKLVMHSNNNALPSGQWNYITVTYNGALAQNSRITIYVNGVDVTNRTDIVSTGTIASLNPTNIRIGQNQPWGDYLNASIDEVRYYNRLLTPAEIITDMNTPIGTDNIFPAVTITSPANGSPVSGTINVTANASDNIGVAGVQFLLDGSSLGTEDLTAPYAVTWNTTTATVGSHVLSAIGRDAAGNTSVAPNITVTVSADFTFTVLNTSRNVEMTGAADYGVDISFLNGFTSNNVALGVTGLPAGVAGAYLVNPLTGAGQTQLHITSTNATPGTYQLTLSATALGITHTQPATLIVNGLADFTLSVSPAIQTVTAGSGTAYSITAGETGDFVSPVTFSISGLPSGASASFNPVSAIPVGTSVLTITTAASTTAGTYSLTLQGASGTITHTLPLTLTVTSVPTGSFPVSSIGSGWDMPIGAAFSKDGQKLFVWEKGGKVYVCNRNATTLQYDKQATPVLDISPEVGNWGDHGLNGFALDPNFDSNGLIYLLYVVDRYYLLNFGLPGYNPNTADNVSEAQATMGRITRYQVTTTGGIMTANPATRAILLGETKSTGIAVLHDSHGMGSLVFASDGTLLASAGDGATYNLADTGSSSQTYYQQALSDGIIRPEENVGAFRSQMLNSHNGKILRIDPVTGNGIPSNPFYDAAQPRSPKSRVWALGFRNPFRFSIRPGTGSGSPSAGDIGEIYVGDVGLRTYEELDIVKAPGSNFGWPIFEGVDYERSNLAGEPPFVSFNTQNRDEPNPLFGTGGCTQRYYTFKGLLKQATADGSTAVFNPCNSSLLITSSNNNRFVHRRPSIDWKHFEDSARVPLFNGNNATYAQIGTGPSNVVGVPFRGNCVIGGFWYTGSLFPANFRNTYFAGEYGEQWIKSFSIGFTDVVQKVQDFASGLGAISCLTENPFDGKLVYVDIGSNSVKSIGYGGNQSPVVKMTADQLYGPTTLNVNFTGNNSFDPDGGALTYLWNFGDATTSVLANPAHSFTAPAGTPKKFTVTLTVKDNQNATATDSIIISVNNTPPQVHITSPVNNSNYRVGPDSTYSFTATVTDNEQAPWQLKYEWQRFLRHNNHEHASAIDTTKNTFASISRVGCNGDSYYWFILLKVTDAAGLSAIDSSKIFPDCAATRFLQPLKDFIVLQQPNGHLVKWTVVAGVPLESFDVERSLDGVHWFVINHQPAAGAGDYVYNDNRFPETDNYYRLRINRAGSGKFYSAIIEINSAYRKSLIIAPNPLNDNFSLQFSSAENGQAVIRVSDMNGKLVSVYYEAVHRGRNTMYLQRMPAWRPGVYIISVQQGADMQRGKLIVL